MGGRLPQDVKLFKKKPFILMNKLDPVLNKIVGTPYPVPEDNEIKVITVKNFRGKKLRIKNLL